MEQITLGWLPCSVLNFWMASQEAWQVFNEPEFRFHREFCTKVNIANCCTGKIEACFFRIWKFMILIRHYQGRSRSCSVTQHLDTSLHRLVTRAKEKWELLKVKVAVEITSNIIKEKEKVSFFFFSFIEGRARGRTKDGKKVTNDRKFWCFFSVAINCHNFQLQRLQKT